MLGTGSLKHLHTFAEVSYIYKINTSTLRKKVSRGELVKGKEVEKFGGTWIITEGAMTKHFGSKQFIEYVTTGSVSDFQFSIGKINAKEKFEEDTYMI